MKTLRNNRKELNLENILFWLGITFINVVGLILTYKSLITETSFTL